MEFHKSLLRVVEVVKQSIAHLLLKTKATVTTVA